MKDECQFSPLLLVLINISNNSTSVMSLVLSHPLFAELTTVIKTILETEQDEATTVTESQRYHCDLNK